MDALSPSAPPLARALVNAGRKALDGALDVRDGDRRHRVYVRAGQAAALTLEGIRIPLGDVLVESGLICTSDHHRSLEMLARGGGLLGEVLVAMGAATTSVVEEGLERQVRRQLHALFEVGSARVDLVENPGLLCAVPLSSRAVRAEEAALLGVRASFGRLDLDGIGRVGRIQTSLGRSRLRLRNGAQHGLDALPFDDDERACLDLLSQPRMFSDLLDRTGADPRRAAALLVYLDLLEALDLSGPPPYRSLFLEKKREAVRRGADPYELLDLLANCSEQELRHAYKRLALEIHPDRLPAGAGAEVRAAAAEVFSALTRAYQDLVDPLRRAEIDARRYARAPATAHDDAQAALDRGIELLRRGDPLGARALLARAAQLRPRDARSLAYLGWASAASPAGLTTAQVLVDRAQQLAPADAEVLYCAGRVFAARGRPSQARAYFAKALGLDPRFRLAQQALVRPAGETP